MTPADSGIDALQLWAFRVFERAYRRRPQEQASREDIAYAFVEALRWAQVSSAFRPSRLQLTHPDHPGREASSRPTARPAARVPHSTGQRATACDSRSR